MSTAEHTSSTEAGGEGSAFTGMTIVTMIVPTLLFLIAAILAGVWLELDQQFLPFAIPPNVVAGLVVALFVLVVAQRQVSIWATEHPTMCLPFQRWIPLLMCILLFAIAIPCLLGFDTELFERTLPNEEVVKGLTFAEEEMLLGFGVAFLIWAMFGYRGALLLFKSGPSFAAQRALVSRATRLIELGNATDKVLTYMKGDKIQILWPSMLAIFLLSLWRSSGGNAAICGWISLAILTYGILLLCFDSVAAFLLGYASMIAILALTVCNRPEFQDPETGIKEGAELILFDSGMDYVPIIAEPIAWMILLLSIGSFVWHFFAKRFGTLNGELCLWSLIGGSRTLPAEDFTVGEDPEDLLEWLFHGLKTIFFRHTKGGDSHDMENVPLATEVYRLISKQRSK